MKEVTRQKLWADKNREVVRAFNRAHYRANRVRYIARGVAARAHGKEAVPVWLTKEHWQEIAEMYEQAQRKTVETGVLHVVDHIWPLKGKNSCGLHVPWNLRIITHARNVAKGNQEPDQ